jgi:hypothetical protein
VERLLYHWGSTYRSSCFRRTGQDLGVDCRGRASFRTSKGGVGGTVSWAKAWSGVGLSADAGSPDTSAADGEYGAVVEQQGVSREEARQTRARGRVAARGGLKSARALLRSGAAALAISGAGE